VRDQVESPIAIYVLDGSEVFAFACYCLVRGMDDKARSAELHSAVSQNCILRGVSQSEPAGTCRRPADWKSAIPQIENLRYGSPVDLSSIPRSAQYLDRRARERDGRNIDGCRVEVSAAEDRHRDRAVRAEVDRIGIRAGLDVDCGRDNGGRHFSDPPGELSDQVTAGCLRDRQHRIGRQPVLHRQVRTVNSESSGVCRGAARPEGRLKTKSRDAKN